MGSLSAGVLTTLWSSHRATSVTVLWSATASSMDAGPAQAQQVQTVKSWTGFSPDFSPKNSKHHSEPVFLSLDSSSDFRTCVMT